MIDPVHDNVLRDMADAKTHPTIVGMWQVAWMATEVFKLRAELAATVANAQGYHTQAAQALARAGIAEAELAAAKAEVGRRGDLIAALSACLEDTLDRARFMGDEETERVIREASEVYAADAAGRGEGER
jgi:hypothetical protein